MNWILFELLTRIPREALNRPPVQEMLRGMAWRAAFTPEQLEALGLSASLTKVLTEVPLVDQVRRSVAARDWPELADAVNAWIGRNLPLSDLIKEIRTYSHELSHSDLAEMAGYYRVYDTPDARLMFAAVIGDQAYLNQAVELREGDASIIARARMGQFDWLEARLDELGAPLGVTTPSFNPDTVQDVFGSVLAARDPKVRKVARAPKVTAIMTLFNPDMDLLPFAIDSALAQEGVETELVVIDDGSEPEIADAIEALLAARPGVIFERSAVNTGPYVGRNRALQLSKGKYVAIQDGDDVSHPARFRTQIEALKTAGDQAMLTTAGHLRIDGGGRPQFEHDFSLVGDGTMTSMFRREVFKAVGPFASVRSRGDVEMRERIRAALGAGAVIHVDYPLVYCNAAPDTLSNRTAR
ncbi:MAG: glycosyltransferase family 2 protein, partial [Brevundimonas sp.]